MEPDSDGYTVNTAATWSTVRCRSTAIVIGWISSLARGATTTPPTIVSEPRRENSFTKPSLNPSILARGFESSASLYSLKPGESWCALTFVCPTVATSGLVKMFDDTRFKLIGHTASPSAWYIAIRPCIAATDASSSTPVTSPAA